MKHNFTSYLKYLRNHNTVPLQRSIIRTGQPNNLLKILTDFPYEAAQPAFDIGLLDDICDLLNIFLNEDRHIISPLYYEDKRLEYSMEQLQNILVENQVLPQFISALLNVVFEELLDAHGNIRDSIKKLFGLDRLVNVTREDKRKLFIESYINEIILPVVIDYWQQKAGYRKNMLGKVKPRLMAQKIFNNIIKKIKINEKTTKDDLRLVKAIKSIQINPAILDRIYASNIYQLESNLLKEIVAIPVIEEAPAGFSFSTLTTTFTNIVFNQQPIDFNTRTQKLLRAACQQEFQGMLVSACSYMRTALQIFMDDSLIARLADLKLYGTPLAVDFDKDDYIKYVSVVDNNNNNHPIDFSFQIITPFEKEVIDDLVNYFHEFLAMQVASIKNFNHNTYFNSFIRKIILYAYAQILDEEGQLRADLAEIFSEEYFPPKTEVRARLIYGYLRKMLITIMTIWLENKEYRQKFKSEHQDFLPLYNMINAIETALSLGLSLDFLSQLQSFPIFNNPEEARRFVIRLPLEETSISTQVQIINAKFRFVLNARKSYEKFKKNYDKKMAKLQICLDKIHERNGEYNNIMANSSKMLHGVREFLTQFNADFENFRNKLTLLMNQSEQLHQLLEGIERAYKNNQIDELQGALAQFSATKTLFTNQLNAVRSEGAELAQGLVSAVGESEKIVGYSEICSNVYKYIADTCPAIMGVADRALANRKRYLLRRDYFPSASQVHNSIGWDNDLEAPADTIRKSFKEMKKELERVEAVCKAVQEDSLQELRTIDDNNLNIEMNKSLLLIEGYKGAIEAAESTIKAATRPLLTLIGNTKAEHEKINGMLQFVLADTALWKSCISSFWGGKAYTIGCIDYKFPNRVVDMMDAQKKLDPRLDPDLKIIAILLAYEKGTAGLGWRYTETKEFYKILDRLIHAENFYSIVEMEKVSAQLENFMKVTCKSRGMFERYERKIGKSSPLSEESLLAKVVSTISDVVGSIGLSL